MSRNKKEIKELIKKWEESGLLDGIENMTTSSMAEMMESQAMQLLREGWNKEKNQNKDVTILPGTITTFEETMEAIKSENAADEDNE
jgi:hypothetical protein